MTQPARPHREHRRRPLAAGPLLLLFLGCGGQGAAPTSADAGADAEGQDTAAPEVEADAEAATLKQAATSAMRLVGTAFRPQVVPMDPTYGPTVAREFSFLTPESAMKWTPIHPARDMWNFERADAAVAFAETHGLEVKGHALLWYGSTPAYVSAMTTDELRAEVDTHIRTVVGRYKGKVLAWDVVNEGVAADGSGLRDTVFRQKLGDGYIADAFRLAHEVDPDALLFYNDFAGEGLGAKSNRIYALADELVKQGVPIHGVGLQMHFDARSYPQPSSVATNMERLAALGLLVNISEMDVRVSGLGGDMASKLDTQRRVFHDMVAVCVAQPRCHAVTFWGFTDKYSWVDGYFGPDDPLLLDDAYAPKPAYFGVLDALLGR